MGKNLSGIHLYYLEPLKVNALLKTMSGFASEAKNRRVGIYLASFHEESLSNSDSRPDLFFTAPELCSTKSMDLDEGEQFAC